MITSFIYVNHINPMITVNALITETTTASVIILILHSY